MALSTHDARQSGAEQMALRTRLHHHVRSIALSQQARASTDVCRHPCKPSLSWYFAAVLTVRFSGVADAQLTADVQEYVAVCGCVGALMTAVVAVMVAV